MSKLREMVRRIIKEETGMYNIYVYRNGAWAIGNKRSLSADDANFLEKDFKKVPSVQQVRVISINDSKAFEKEQYLDRNNEKDYHSTAK